MRNNGVLARLFVTLAVAIAVPLLIIAIPGYSQSVKSLQKDDEEMRRSMVTISRQLGVECTTCHNTKNFGLTTKNEYRVAKEHLRITQMLIDNGFDGKEKRPKADCYMCHRGQLKPNYKEPFDPVVMEKEKVTVPTGDDESGLPDKPN